MRPPVLVPAAREAETTALPAGTLAAHWPGCPGQPLAARLARQARLPGSTVASRVVEVPRMGPAANPVKVPNLLVVSASSVVR
jgi:hypothetical protein